MLLPNFYFSKEEQQSWINGNQLSGSILAKLVKEKITKRVLETKRVPGLAVMLVGNDPASNIYVGYKQKDAQEVGFNSIVRKLPAKTPEEKVLKIIEDWNEDPKIQGILVQLPLPKGIDTQKVINSIMIEKDVDGFHQVNTGRLWSKQNANIPCTPLGIGLMLKELGENLSGKKALVLGRSNIVGKPMAAILMDEFQCTVTIAHSKSVNLKEEVERADVIVAAMGVREIVFSDWIKDDSIVIDVGMHRIGNRLTGDLELGQFKNRIRYYTPVPGGVGPMTRAMLLYNTIKDFT